MVNFLLIEFELNRNSPAIIWDNKTLTYGDLLDRIADARKFVAEKQITQGKVISLLGDFTPNAIAILITLIENNNIVVPFNSPIKDAEKIKYNIAEVEGEIKVNLEDDTYSFQNFSEEATHDYYKRLRKDNAPGLVLFTSGTSGFPKGAVHDFGRLLKKFATKRKSMRTVNFLMFDHWGGLNTLFHTLSNCGVVLALRNRKPEAVCEFVEKFKIELLPVSPSFLNLMILSGTYNQYDLSFLKVITYGTEPMPQSTLKRAKELFPNVIFQQTYGLIELGVLRAKSKSDDSLWVKLGGDGYELRVVDSILQIKADSAMLGYLNAQSPFTEDGFFITGDQVEVDGEYYKILGRKSEIINVGGDKVYPQEVENILLGMENILEATVFGEKHALMGNIVCARLSLNNTVDPKEFIREVKMYCKERMQPFKVPVKIIIEDGPLFNDRYKKRRKF
jgi:long-chain acyl-CoA synthetase